MSIDSVLREALTLPSRERSEVVAKLLASLDDEASHDDLDGVRAAWSEELEHRARLALSGEDPGEPWSVVRDRAQAKLARGRAPISRFPYHVAYIVADDPARILAIAHDRRRPNYWASRATW